MNHRLIEALMTGIAPIIREYVATGLAAIDERMKKIESREPVKGEKGEPGEPGQPGEIGPPGEPGKEGQTGRDGQPGVPGRDGNDGNDGKDGEPGKDGADGLGFDDMDVTHDGERGFTVRFMRGDKIKQFAFTLPVMLDRGVWKEGKFTKGDAVSWGGSVFIAQTDTTEKPSEFAKDWRLAVRRGRDGKDGKNGERGLQGLKGERGETGQRGYGG